MSLNETPKGERTHIGIFGRRNAGKSSIMNALTGQSMSIVSDTPGTTTDPVSKAMEILPLGPVLITDTPGFDDEGSIGSMRVEKSYEALRKTDIAIIVLSAEDGIDECEADFIREIINRKLPYIICINKTDLCDNTAPVINELKRITPPGQSAEITDSIVFTSTVAMTGITELKEKLGHSLTAESDRHLISDLICEGDTVVLVIPIDESAPKGRLILPQQQVMRDILECGACAVVTRETELADTLKRLTDKPRAVVTDSQAFKLVSEIVPEDVDLTSFSILMARYKGDLEWQYEGAKALDSLQDNANVLISEGCTHHRQCGDIGTVKLPAWINNYTKKKINYSFTSGGEFPTDVSGYDLIIHCGGCMLNDKEMAYRIKKARECAVPITNYGIAIAYMNGIVKRSLRLLTTQGK